MQGLTLSKDLKKCILSLPGEGRNSSQLNDLQEMGLEEKKINLFPILFGVICGFGADQANDITFFAYRCAVCLSVLLQGITALANSKVSCFVFLSFLFLFLPE